jgi:hypothetical protein
MFQRIGLCAMLGASVYLAGCASIVNGQNQPISVETRNSAGPVAGANCKLTNDKGTWFVTTPGSTTVHRSYGDLAIHCTKDTLKPGFTTVKSSTKAMAAGNLLFGGVIGVAVDVGTGAAYDYPSVVTVHLATNDPAQGSQANPERQSREARAMAAAAPGLVLEYRLRDRANRQERSVIYRLDRVDGDRLVFNQGSRVETTAGAVVDNTAPIGGDFDVAMPPGGWIAGDLTPGATWSRKYRSGVPGQVVGMDIEARVLGESSIPFKEREVRVVQVQFTGYTERIHAIGANRPGRYEATAWYSPDLKRVLRFEVASRGGLASGQFYVDEQLELVDIRNE